MLCPISRCSDHYNVYPVCQLPMEVLDKKEKALEEIGEARWPEPRNPGRRKRKPVFGQKIPTSDTSEQRKPVFPVLKSDDSEQKSHVRPTKKRKHKKKKTNPKTPKNTRVQKKIEKIKKEIKEMKKKKSKNRNKNRNTKSRGRDE